MKELFTKENLICLLIGLVIGLVIGLTIRGNRWKTKYIERTQDAIDIMNISNQYKDYSFKSIELASEWKCYHDERSAQLMKCKKLNKQP